MITNLSSYLVHAPSVKAGEVVGQIDTSLEGVRTNAATAPIWNKTF